MTKEEQTKELLKLYETLTPEEKSKVMAKIAEIKASRKSQEADK